MHVSGGVGWVGEVSATEIRVLTILTPSSPPVYVVQYRIQFLALDLVDQQLLLVLDLLLSLHQQFSIRIRLAVSAESSTLVVIQIYFLVLGTIN